MLIALILTGGLVYYSGGFDFSLFDFLLPQEDARVRLLVPPVKQTLNSKKSAKKHQKVSSLADELTFFETLSDSAFEKYVGLDGKIKNQVVSVKKNFSTLKTTANTRNGKKEHVKKIFAVQASSFKRLDRASKLVEKLKKKGYPAYFSTFRSYKDNYLWYRVFLGKYDEHPKAIKVAEKARAEEDLNPMIIFKKE